MRFPARWCSAATVYNRPESCIMSEYIYTIVDEVMTRCRNQICQPRYARVLIKSTGSNVTSVMHIRHESRISLIFYHQKTQYPAHKFFIHFLPAESDPTHWVVLHATSPRALQILVKMQDMVYSNNSLPGKTVITFDTLASAERGFKE